LKISKPQINHYLRNNMLISIKKPTFDLMTRNSDNNLQTRYEWFMKWKGSDLDHTKNCVFIDEAALKTAKQKKRRKLTGGKEQATLLLKSLLWSTLVWRRVLPSRTTSQ
jgi:hypothetical protein